MTESSSIVRIDSLKVSFGRGPSGFEAVRSLSLKIDKGKCLGIVGESGSGKSVTSLALMGLHPADTTKIDAEALRLRVEGKALDLGQLNERSWQEIRGRRIAMIFQEPMSSLNPVMKCGRQVTEAIMTHFPNSREEAREKTLALFREVKLPDPERAFDSYPHQLSGGQKQRVMIAMALSCDPELLIADEPTTALDVTVQHSILELLSGLRLSRNMAMLFITHDLGVVAEIADDLAVMRKGELIEYGPVMEVMRSPKAAYTKGLMACRPQIGVKRRFLPTVRDFENGKDWEEVFAEERFKEWTAGEILDRKKLLDSSEDLLRVKDLDVIYRSPGRPDFKALDKVNFEVRKGETLGLVGESGCGKTTLSRTLLGLIPVSGGEIDFAGHPIHSAGKQEMRTLRKRMQLIFQDPMSSLNPRTSIGVMLDEVMKVHGLGGSASGRKDKAVWLMEQVGLEAGALERFPHEFSGGQRQRIVIARALAVEPEFIICDESVAALDVSVQAQVLNLLNSLKDQFGLTYIFITHDLSVVYHMSDRIMVMNAGKVEELGDAEQIVMAPRSGYTKRLINSIPGLKRSW